METPTITIHYKPRHKEDPKPYLVDADFPDGRDYHAEGATPYEALLELAIFWRIREVGR